MKLTVNEATLMDVAKKKATQRRPKAREEINATLSIKRLILSEFYPDCDFYGAWVLILVKFSL